MKCYQLLMIVTAGFFVTACAHVHPVEGPRDAEQIPTGVRVRIGSAEVKEGEQVSVIKSVCKESVKVARGGDMENCRRQKVGEATVVKVLDHDSAVVQAVDGIAIDESMMVEK